MQKPYCDTFNAKIKKISRNTRHFLYEILHRQTSDLFALADLAHNYFPTWKLIRREYLLNPQKRKIKTINLCPRQPPDWKKNNSDHPYRISASSDPIESHLETPRTNTALSYRGVWGWPLIRPLLSRKTPFSRTGDERFRSLRQEKRSQASKEAFNRPNSPHNFPARYGKTFLVLLWKIRGGIGA